LRLWIDPEAGEEKKEEEKGEILFLPSFYTGVTLVFSPVGKREKKEPFTKGGEGESRL